MEENEISKNSNGGTELVKRRIGAQLANLVDLDQFQIICSRVRELDPSKIRIYWIHDLPSDPELAHLANASSRERFHQLVFCGHWQYQQFQDHLGVPYDATSVIIDNSIEPFPSKEVSLKSTDQIRLIYTSTPQRGLALLVPVFKKLAKDFPNLHLDVFSSFKIYGWEEADANYQSLYDEIIEHPQMTYHGFKSNDVVREYMAKAHIFAYPSIWKECNSLSLIEAMSARALAVHPNYGGLQDTSGAMTFQYQGTADPNHHANIFYAALRHAITTIIDNPLQTAGYLDFVKAYADYRYGQTKVVSTWEKLLNNLLMEYPTVESRAFSEKQGYFSFTTR